MNKQRWIAVVVLLTVWAVAATAFLIFRDNSSKSSASNSSTTKPTSTTQPGVFGVVTISATPTFRGVLDLLKAGFEAQNPTARVRYTLEPATVSIVNIAAGKGPDLLLSYDEVVQNARKKVKRLPPSKPFGENLFVVATPKGNPGHLTDLSVFNAKANKRAAICGPVGYFGYVGRNLLRKAKINTRPLPADDCGVDPIGRLALKQLDAALMLRTDTAPRTKDIGTVEIPDNQNAIYRFSYVVAKSNPVVVRFLQFLDSDLGLRIRTEHGLLP